MMDIDTLIKEGLKMSDACTQVGISESTYRRWLQKPEPSTYQCGRAPKFVLTEDEKSSLRYFRLHHGSIPMAVDAFLKSESCAGETRSALLAILDEAAVKRARPAWPMSLRRAAEVTDEMRNALRGPKHALATDFTERRDLSWIDAAGERHQLRPHSIWESDDESDNRPFYFTDPFTGKEVVGRQTLNTRDVFAGAWLGTEPIGRERDAYRAEDIADHMLGCVTAFGMPEIWRLELGSWASNFVLGTPIVPGSATRWGSLDALFKLHHVFKSQAKGAIEKAFDVRQNKGAHASLDIGRSRGEFEAAAKKLRQAQQTERRPRDLGFWSIEECAEQRRQEMAELNCRPAMRRAHGGIVVPNDLLQSARGLEVPESEMWRFCPVKRPATVRGGHIETSVDQYAMSFRFRVNGVIDDLYLGQGHRVLIAFHPGRPQEGCHIFNAETGAANRENLSFGQHIMLAPCADDVPQVNFSTGKGGEFAPRRRANAAVRREFRAIVPVGRAGMSRSHAQDNNGNAARVERNISITPTSRATEANADFVSAASGPGAGRRKVLPASSQDDDDLQAQVERMEREAMERMDFLHT